MSRAVRGWLAVVATLLYLGCNTEPGDDSDASHEGTAGAVSASGGDAGARAGALNAGQGGTPPAGAGQAGASQGVGGAGVGGVDGGAGTGGGGGGSAEPLTLRVLTFNIKTGSLSSLQTVADIIEASGADVVGLQEVDKGTQRAGGVDQPMLLGELTDMQPFFAPGLHEYDGGQYGVAALVSHDFRAVTVTPHDLEQPAAGEARAALEVRLARIQKNADIPDFIFITTHWDLVSENRVAQAEHVNRIGMTGEELAPLLLVGDLNARSGSEPIDRLLGFWTAADEAVFGIDWIVHRGERWQVSDVRELTDADHPQATTASDHVPVVASYTLAPP